MGGGNNRGGCVSFLCLSDYWLSAKSLSWPTELADGHQVQINHHTVCVSASCVVFDCILIMTKLHTHHAQTPNGYFVAKNTADGLWEH